VTLQAECGTSEKTAVNGVEAYWIRARVDEPLPPDPARVLALVDRIRVRSVIERPAFEWAVVAGRLPSDLRSCEIQRWIADSSCHCFAGS
jgi:hypothetical protein